MRRCIQSTASSQRELESGLLGFELDSGLLGFGENPLWALGKIKHHWPTSEHAQMDGLYLIHQVINL